MFTPIEIDRLLERVYPPNYWLIEGLVPLHATTIVSAPPKTGKTWFMLEVALSVAEGIPLLGNLRAEQGGVLFIDEDNGERLIWDRLSKLGPPEGLPIHILSCQSFKVSEQSMKWVRNYCKEHGITLVIIDPLVRVHGAKENDAGEMSAVFQLLRKLHEHDITLLIAHHDRKGRAEEYGSDNMRGSSDILASCDCHISLSKSRGDNSKIIVKQQALRQDEPIPSFAFSLAKNGTGISISAAEGTEALIPRNKHFQAIYSALEGRPLPRQQLIETLGLKERQASETIREAVKEGVMAEQREGNSKTYFLPESEVAMWQPPKDIANTAKGGLDGNE